MRANFNERLTTGVGEAVHAILANSAIAALVLVTNQG